MASFGYVRQRIGEGLESTHCCRFPHDTGWTAVDRACVKNAEEPIRRRIIFSIALFLIVATARFLFRLTKSRSTFYAQIECLSFHTASTLSGRSLVVFSIMGKSCRKSRSE